jgi:ribonuclease HI
MRAPLCMDQTKTTHRSDFEGKTKQQHLSSSSSTQQFSSSPLLREDHLTATNTLPAWQRGGGGASGSDGNDHGEDLDDSDDDSEVSAALSLTQTVANLTDNDETPVPATQQQQVQQPLQPPPPPPPYQPPENEMYLFGTFNVYKGNGVKCVGLIEPLLVRYRIDVLALQEAQNVCDNNDALFQKMLLRHGYSMTKVSEGCVFVVSGRLLVDMHPDPLHLPNAVPEIRMSWIRVFPRIFAKRGEISLLLGNLHVRNACPADTLKNFLGNVPSNAILLGDLNAHVAGSDGTITYRTAMSRGEVLREWADDVLFDFPAHTGPTHFSKAHKCTSTIDHILIGPEVYTQLVSNCENVIVLGDLEFSASDHRPVVWHAAWPEAAQIRVERHRTRTIWSLCTEEHLEAYRKEVMRLLNKHPDDKKLKHFEEILLRAGRTTLPQSKGGKIFRTLFAPMSLRSFGSLENLDRNKGEMVGDDLSDDPLPALELEIFDTHVAMKHFRQQFTRVVESCMPLDSNIAALGWQSVNKLFNLHRSVEPPGPLIADKSKPHELTTEPSKIADLHAKCIASMHAHPDPATGAERFRYMKSNIKMIPASIAELYAAVKSAKCGTCADGLLLNAEHYRSLVRPGIEQPELEALLERFNIILDDPSCIPIHLRTAIATPAPKPQKKSVYPENHRPLAVTPQSARIMEAILLRRMETILKLAESQFGFRQRVPAFLPLLGLSFIVEDALSTPQHHQRCIFVATKLDKTKLLSQQTTMRVPTTLIVCVDCVSAFCRGIPEVVAAELAKYPELRGEADWIYAFLQRRIRVKSGEVLSEPVKLERGLPQGTKLGPILWKVFINILLRIVERICQTPDAEDQDFQDDLREQTDPKLWHHNQEVLKARSEQYRGVQPPNVYAVPIIVADDMNFVFQHADPARCIAKANSVIKAVRKWCDIMGIELSKIQAGFINHSNGENWTAEQKRVLKCGGKIGDIPVHGAQGLKLLGVIFDREFRFKAHVAAIYKTARSRIARLYRMHYYFDASVLKQVYIACVLVPMLYSCEVFWPFINQEDKDLLERAHYAGARFVSGNVCKTHSLSVLATAGLYPLEYYVHESMIRTRELLLQHKPGGNFGPGWVAALAFRPSRDMRQWSVRSVCALAPSRTNFLTNQENSSRVEFEPKFHPSLFGNSDKIPIVWQPPDGLKVIDGDAANLEAREKANAARLKQVREKHAGKQMFEVFPDGSVFTPTGGAQQKGGCLPVQCGGGAFAIFKDGKRIHSDYVLTSPYSASFTPELEAILASLSTINSTTPQQTDQVVCVFTDSQSSLRALDRRPILARLPRAQRIWTFLRLLQQKGVRVEFYFIFAHAGVAENDFVDLIAKEAAKASYDHALHGKRITRRGPVPLYRADAHRARMEVVKADAVKVLRGREALQHFRGVYCDEVFTIPPPIPRIWQIQLARVQCGACPAIGGASHYDLDDEDCRCPVCGKVDALGRSGKTSRHLIECVSAEAQKIRTEFDVTTCKDLFVKEKTEGTVRLIRLFIEARRRRRRELFAQAVK